MASKKVSTPESYFEGGEDYSAGQTGGDSLDWSEKKVPDLPQRGRRPALSLAPEGSDFYTGNTFSENCDSSSANEDYKDLGAVDNNWPAKQRTDWNVFEHGWQIEPNEALPAGKS